MPTYIFKNLQTDTVEEHFMKMSELNSFKEKNAGILQHMLSTNGLVYEPGTHLKVDNGFREVIQKIKGIYKINNIREH